MIQITKFHVYKLCLKRNFKVNQADKYNYASLVVQGFKKVIIRKQNYFKS